MIFKLSKNNDKCIIQLSEDEIKIIKKNNNQIIINKEEMPHLKNHLMHVVFSLAKTENGRFVESKGNEVFHPEDLTKK
jgi:hypothetical protein